MKKTLVLSTPIRQCIELVPGNYGTNQPECLPRSNQEEAVRNMNINVRLMAMTNDCLIIRQSGTLLDGYILCLGLMQRGGHCAH